MPEKFHRPRIDLRWPIAELAAALRNVRCSPVSAY